jgi:hypothetical protein
MIVPVYLPYYVLTGAIGTIAAMLFGLRSALRTAGWTTYDRTVTASAATITVIGWFLLALALASARIIDAVPLHWLIGVQLYRALGVIFLILYGTGKLPGAFAWPASFGDVLVGVLAPVVAVAYARAPHKNADLVSAWNLFGLADLVVAVTAGFLTSPSPLQLFAFDLPSELVSQFPLVLVPVFLVPVSVLLHLASLTKLRRDALRDNDSREIARVAA